MLKIIPILIVLQLSIDVKENNKIDIDRGNGNKTNLLNLSTSKKSIGVSYLTSKSAKKGNNNPNSSSNNTKKSVEAAKGSDYLTLGAKKALNLL